MRATAPGSSANLGPGFDALAIAMSIYITVDVREADSFSLINVGAGASLPCDEEQLVAKIVKRVRGDLNVAIRVESDIPISRGIGSSAALALTAAAAAGATNPYVIAAEFDGHPENAAASFYGGLVAAANLASGPHAQPLKVDDNLVLVTVIPDMPISTRDARRVLPDSYSRADVVHNLSRVTLVAHALGDLSKLSPDMFDDCLHQPYRTALFAQSAPLLKSLVSAGCGAAAWSGAGSALVGFAHRDTGQSACDDVRIEMQRLGVDGDVQVIEVDRKGLIVSSD